MKHRVAEITINFSDFLQKDVTLHFKAKNKTVGIGKFSIPLFHTDFTHDVVCDKNLTAKLLAAKKEKMLLFPLKFYVDGNTMTVRNVYGQTLAVTSVYLSEPQEKTNSPFHSLDNVTWVRIPAFVFKKFGKKAGKDKEITIAIDAKNHKYMLNLDDLYYIDISV